MIQAQYKGNIFSFRCLLDSHHLLFCRRLVEAGAILGWALQSVCSLRSTYLSTSLSVMPTAR
jgi:hypothetical protein